MLALPSVCDAQTFGTIGSRAQGMGGAFVGVADDASSVYWNPAGLAGGAYFSLVLDGSTGTATPDDDPIAGSRGGWLLGLSTPALGISYYRLRAAAVRSIAPRDDSGPFQLDSLVTHHAGVTLVQSLADGLAVGTTVKLIRGIAASVVAPASHAEELLDGWDVMGRSSNRLDLDVGIMASGNLGRAGLTIRNLTEPEFKTGGDRELQLERQVRAGASILLLPGWKMAADFDVTRNHGPFGDVRELALGTESQLTRRVAARGGVRFNTAGDRGRSPAASVGGSFALMGTLLVDAHVTGGADESLRGWGVAGRLVF